MKIVKITVLIFFIAQSFISYSQELKLEDKIIIVRKNFNYINENISSFEKSSKDVYMSTEGGVVTLYKKDNVLVKVQGQYYGETGKAFIDSYYINGDLSFIFRQDFYYNAPMYRDKEIVEDSIVFPAFDPEKTELAESRYYFYDSKMIRWINPDGEYFSADTAEFKEMEERLLKFNKELMEEIEN